MLGRILYAEDDAAIAELIKTLLENKGYLTQWARDGEEVMHLIPAFKPSLILLDVMMPKMNGYAVLEQLQQHSEYKAIPVIFLTVKAETDSKVVGLRMGSYDYITKPFDIEELLARVETVLRIKSEHDRLLQVNRRLADLSMTDPLTGLYNRRFLTERLREEIDRAKRYQYPIACIIIDIDDFKKVNDSYGHVQGDQVLQQVALLLKNSTRVVDIVVRYGGEEFLVILPQTDIGGAEIVGERFRNMILEKGALVNNTFYPITISLGASAFASANISSEVELVKQADTALYLAKRQGKNRLAISPRISKN
jgi:two-component system, cell cycle response regulator